LQSEFYNINTEKVGNKSETGVGNKVETRQKNPLIFWLMFQHQ